MSEKDKGRKRQPDGLASAGVGAASANSNQTIDQQQLKFNSLFRELADNSVNAYAALRVVKGEAKEEKETPGCP